MTRNDLRRVSAVDHLTGDRLQRYRSGRMNAEERKAVERHLLSCQLCSEAVEGIGKMQTPEHLDRIRRDMHRRISERLRNPRRIFPEHFLPVLLITLVVLALVTWLGFYLAAYLR
jgi:ferric-dicitrate binding protein FerR (iron transport regulator)